MKNKLQLKQLDKKIRTCKRLQEAIPDSGWINAMRVSLDMSLAQFGKRLGITAQSAREMEQREKSGALSLKLLDEAAKAFGLRMTYGFYNPGRNIIKITEDKAGKLAEEIVMKAHRTMRLEGQANSHSRIKQAIKEKKEELLKDKMRRIWD